MYNRGMAKLVPLLHDLSHLTEDEQRELVYELAQDEVITFLEKNQLLVLAKDLPQAEAALDRYHQRKLQSLAESHSAMGRLVAFLRNLWPG